jgi:hypothetical protein
MRPKRSVVAGLACVLLLVTACSGSSHGPSGTGSVHASLTPPSLTGTPTRPPADGVEVQLPLDSYANSSSQDGQVLSQATDLLVQRCMQRLGFTYTVAGNSGAGSGAASGGPGGQAGPSALPERVEPYGPTDPATARTNGYSNGANIASRIAHGQSMGIPTVTQLIAEHGSAWVIALYGAIPPASPPPGKPQGCEGATDGLYNAAYGSIDRNIVGELIEKADQTTSADSRVQRVEQTWSKCMATRGYQYSTPMQPPQQRWPAIASKAEIATALADVACKQRTNLPGVWLAVERGYQQQLVEQNAAVLQQFENDYRSLLRASQDLIAHQPSATPTH